MTHPDPTPTPKPTAQPSGTLKGGEDYVELSSALRRLAICLTTDESSADDFVQEAWLAALDTPSGRIRDLNSWLRQVLRRLASREMRERQLRRDVERQAASPEVQNPESTSVESRSAREFLEGAVDELDEPVRSVMSMRFFEELSVNEIAEKLERPRRTVRTQMRRGLHEMRAYLDRRNQGERSVWSVLLLRVAHLELDGERTALSKAPMTSSFGHLAFWILLVISTPLLLWWGLGSDSQASLEVASFKPLEDDQDREQLPAVPDEPVRPEGAGRRAGVPATPVDEVESAPATLESETRNLEIVIWLENGSKAESTMAQVYGAENALIGSFKSDENGRLVIPLSEDQLVGPPSIYGSHPGVWVYARAKDECWSNSYGLPIPPEGRLLELNSAGPSQSIRGQVLDEEGRPVGGALIEFEYPDWTLPRTADGIAHVELEPYHVTQDDGRFEFTGLSIRPHPIVVRAPGLAPEEVIIDRAELTIARDFVLSAGARVIGEVLHQNGSPAVGARVWRPSLPTARGERVPVATVTDEFGYFELSGLLPGKQHVFARHAERASLFACTIVDLERDGEALWDAVLEHTDGIHVRAVESTGEPVPHAGAALVFAAKPSWGDLQIADDQGRMHFPHAPQGDLTLAVRRSNVDPNVGEFFRGLRPSPEVVVVTLPAVVEELLSISGVLLDSSGKPFERAIVTGSYKGPAFEQATEPATGMFRAESLLPGDYRLSAVVPGRGGIELGKHTLLPGESKQVDELRALPPGQLVLDWGDQEPNAESPWVLRFLFVAGEHYHRDVLLLEDPAAVLQLLPGPYSLHPRNREAVEEDRVIVTSGQTTFHRPAP